MKHRLVIIYWEDIYNTGGWKTVEVARKQPPAKCISIGIYINKDAKYTRIAAGFAPSIGEEDPATYGGVETIPNACISKIRNIKTLDY